MLLVVLLLAVYVPGYGVSIEPIRGKWEVKHERSSSPLFDSTDTVQYRVDNGI